MHGDRGGGGGGGEEARKRDRPPKQAQDKSLHSEAATLG